MLLNNQCVIEKKNIEEYLETNNKVQHIKTWDAAETVLTGKFTAKNKNKQWLHWKARNISNK